MSVRIRFFARFRELLGSDIVVQAADGTTIAGLLRSTISKNREGNDAIFDETGCMRDYVIVMKNGKRIETADAGKTSVADGDEVAIFPPVAGG